MELPTELLERTARPPILDAGGFELASLGMEVGEAAQRHRLPLLVAARASDDLLAQLDRLRDGHRAELCAMRQVRAGPDFEDAVTGLLRVLDDPLHRIGDVAIAGADDAHLAH